jgi:hypothetical protein
VLGVVGVEGVLALGVNVGGGAAEHGCWSVSSEAAVAVFGGVEVKEIGGPLAGVVEVVELVRAAGIVLDGLEQ